MQNHSTPSPVFLTRTQSPIWQDQLRACVRLYLRQGANPELEQELDELLQRSEAELLDYLLVGTPPTADDRARAQHFLDTAQHELLRSPQEVAQLLGNT